MRLSVASFRRIFDTTCTVSFLLYNCSLPLLCKPLLNPALQSPSLGPLLVSSSSSPFPSSFHLLSLVCLLLLPDDFQPEVVDLLLRHLSSFSSLPSPSHLRLPLSDPAENLDGDSVLPSLEHGHDKREEAVLDLLVESEQSESLGKLAGNFLAVVREALQV